MKYYVDCWETAVRFTTVEVDAHDEEDAKLKAFAIVDFEGAEWNTEEVGADEAWIEEE